jgi:hypothetical protein
MPVWRDNVLIRKALRGAAIAIADTRDEVIRIMPVSSGGLNINPLSASGANTRKEVLRIPVANRIYGDEHINGPALHPKPCRNPCGRIAAPAMANKNNACPGRLGADVVEEFFSFVVGIIFYCTSRTNSNAIDLKIANITKLPIGRTSYESGVGRPRRRNRRRRPLRGHSLARRRRRSAPRTALVIVRNMLRLPIAAALIGADMDQQRPALTPRRRV